MKRERPPCVQPPPKFGVHGESAPRSAILFYGTCIARTRQQFPLALPAIYAPPRRQRKSRAAGARIVERLSPRSEQRTSALSPLVKICGLSTEPTLRAAHFDLCKVEVYLLDVEKRLTSYKEQGQRETRWFPLDEAADLVDEQGLSALLRGKEAQDFGRR